MKIQDVLLLTRILNLPKNRHQGTIAQISPAISSNYGMYRQSEKIVISSTRPHNMANIGKLTAEIRSGVWGTL